MTGGRSTRREGSVLASRVRCLRLAASAILACFLVVCVKYQILGQAAGRSLLTMSGLQRIETVPAAMARGLILDRYGVPLTAPVWRASCVIFPQLVKDRVRTVQALEEALQGAVVQPEDPRWSGDRPIKVASGIDSETARKIAALSWSGIQGVYVVPEQRRYGPQSMACHVVGYVPPSAYSSPADNVGQMGLEKSLDSYLKGGLPPWVGILVAGDRSTFPGSSVRVGPGSDEVRDVRTTIDARIQKVVEDTLDAMRVSRGAVVVLDADTAEVLAMASRPEFSQDAPGSSVGREDGPFLNRAVRPFLPGSVFKTVVVAAALESGAIQPDDRFICRGTITVGDREIRCPRAHGELTVAEALAHSCNCVLIEIALRIGAASLVEFARNVGFGKLTGIELPEEEPGFLPEPWDMLPGDVANLAIGQGYVGVSPLQAAVFFRTLITGSLKYPTLLLPAQGSDDAAGTKTVREERRILSEGTCSVLRESLLLATTQGTGRLAWVPRRGSAGKTGTAEVDGGRPPHAWFVGFCPVVAPKYVIAVFVENGGDGPSVAAPVFREIATAILER